MNWPREIWRRALVCDGAEALPNPNGSARGFYLEQEGCAVVLFPGPPQEMKPMFENHVQSRLEKLAGDIRFARRVLRVAGMGENAADQRIVPNYSKYENPQTTNLFHRSEIEVHLRAQGRTEAEAEAVPNVL